MLINQLNFNDFFAILRKIRRYDVIITLVAREADAKKQYDDVLASWSSLHDLTGKHVAFVFAGKRLNKDSALGWTRPNSGRIDAIPEGIYIPNGVDLGLDKLSEHHGYMISPKAPDRQYLLDHQTLRTNEIKTALNIKEEEIPCLHFYFANSGMSYTIALSAVGSGVYQFMKTLLSKWEAAFYELSNELNLLSRRFGEQSNSTGKSIGKARNALKRLKEIRSKGNDELAEKLDLFLGIVQAITGTPDRKKEAFALINKIKQGNLSYPANLLADLNRMVDLAEFIEIASIDKQILKEELYNKSDRELINLINTSIQINFVKTSKPITNQANQMKKAIKRGVIFIHGLNGDISTWQGESTRFIDTLNKEKDITDKFDLMPFEYQTQILELTGFKKMLSIIPKLNKEQFNVGTRRIAMELVSYISEVLRDYDTIALVAHSMGGLVAKRAMVEMEEDQLKKIKFLLSLSVPHHGSGLANIGNVLLGNKQLIDLKLFSEFTDDLTNRFSNLRNKPVVIYQSGSQDIVVKEASAIPAGVVRKYRIDTADNHYSVLKIDDSSNHIPYLRLTRELNEILNLEKQETHEPNKDANIISEIQILGWNTDKVKLEIGSLNCSWRKDGSKDILTNIEIPKFKITNMRTGIIENNHKFQYLHSEKHHKWTAEILADFQPDGNIKLLIKHTNYLDQSHPSRNIDYQNWHDKFTTAIFKPMKVTPISDWSISFDFEA